MGFQLSTENFYEIEAQYFIDCTGDGTLGALANVPFSVGREAQSEYNESLAPQVADRQTLGNSILFFSKKTESPVTYRAPSFVYGLDYIESIIDRGGRVVNEEMNGSDCWWFEYGGSIDTIKDAQNISFELKKLALGVWNYIKNSGKFHAQNLTLEWIGNIPGKRESRRMTTDYLLTQNDILNRTAFSDASFYGGWYLDFHPSDGIYTEDDFCSQIPVGVYPVPLRTLYNNTVGNLMFAGRDIGTTHAAFASTRIMNTCALSGQAAGTLAAFCSEAETFPSDLNPEQVQKIQQHLLRMDMFIPGIINTDKDDLAKQALVKVSSVVNGTFEQVSGAFSLEKGGYLVVPSSLQEISIKIRSEADFTLECDCYSSSLPSALLAGCRKIENVHFSVKKGEQWVTVSLPKADTKSFLIIAFPIHADLEIVTTEEQSTGILGGCSEMAEHWYPCFKANEKDMKVLYGGENLLNGYSRPWNHPNVWVSAQEDKSPSITLSWEEKQTVGSVELFFNPDLSMELNSSRATIWSAHHKFAPRGQMPPQLVKSFQIYGKEEPDSEYQLLSEYEGNWQRKLSVKLPEPKKIRELKVVIVSTYGAKSAEVFEIRAYK